MTIRLATEKGKESSELSFAREVKEKSQKVAAISDSIEAVVRRGIPQWLELEKEKSKGVVNGFPVREDLTMPIQEQLIVELYSK